MIDSGSEHLTESGAPAPVLEADVVEVMRTIYDPEIPVNIYDLGLIYETTVNPDNSVLVRMTLTAPNCPVADILPAEVETRIRRLEGVTDVRVILTFDPPYTMEMMSEEARLELGLL
jgi:FeS assembly SUF system protein